MEWKQPLRGRLQGWRVPAALAGSSLVPVLPWRSLTDLGSWLGEVLDVVGVGVIVGLPVVGAERLGLALAWLLIGHLTYRYTHLLYPGEYETVVDYNGFRVLTALGTLYFGVVCWGLIIPMAVPVQILTASSLGANMGLMILALISGTSGGGLLFGLYLRRWHPERLYDEKSDLTAMFDTFFLEDDAWRTLPGRWHSVYRWQQAAAYSMFPTLICIVVGLAAVILNMVYPIPEAVFLAGLVALRLHPDTGPTAEQVPQYEVDMRLLDAMSGAVQNPKGFMMITFSFFGMLVYGATWLISTFFITTIISQIVQTGFTEIGVAGRAYPVDLAWVRALGGFALVLFVLALFIAGVYSLVHWVRQLERIEPYVHQWGDEDGDRVADDEDVPALVTRPPGLLVPAQLPFIGFYLSLAAIATDSVLVIAGILAVSVTVAVVVMGWGLVWTWRHRHDPQPLTHESRDLLVTVLLQFGVIGVPVIAELSELEIRTKGVLVMVLSFFVMIGLFYFSEMYRWQSEQEGIRKLAGVAPLVVAFILLIAIARLSIEGSILLVESVLVGFAVVSVILSLVDIYIEDIVE